MTLTLRNIQLDCPPASFERTVAFWSAALGGEPVDSDGGRYVHLHGVRSPVEVHLQRLDDGPSRIHLDLAADDVDGEVARLEGLGATVVTRPVDGIVVLRDPVGLVLCVVAGAAPPDPLSEARSPGVRLDALIVDVEGEQVAAAEAFWLDALQAGSMETTEHDRERWTSLLGVRVAGGELPVEVQRLRDGAPRFHVDLSTDEVDGEARRLEELGAMRVGQGETWTTFTDPAGNPFCVVPVG